MPKSPPESVVMFFFYFVICSSMQYIEDQTLTSEPISIDSDWESNKSDSECDPGVPTKEQDMFIWNPTYQVRSTQNAVMHPISLVGLLFFLEMARVCSNALPSEASHSGT